MNALKMNIKINETIFDDLIIGDGALVSTSVGSTAYAKNLGGQIYPFKSRLMQFVPISCSVNNNRLHSLPLNHNDELTIFLNDADFRNCRLCYDGFSKDFHPNKIMIKESINNVKVGFISVDNFIAKAYNGFFNHNY
jgi:NAD kinase